MTSRLKRKLVDLGVDPSSSKANESFCLIGTPLPPLEKSKDTGEFVPLWKQEVRDEKGRRRLHGAFTGGFSAGYFNTVGSKEGWTPQTFVSSRSDRSKQKKARPEDFMDEEDLAEIAASRTVVDTTEEMNLIGGTQAELGQRGDDDDEAASMARKLEQSLLPAPKDSVGARILKKMGWRVGQGIGPRLTLRQRLAQDALYAAGAAGAVDNAEGEEDADEAGKHTYAPRDTPLLLAPRKDNSHGLGYRPGMGLSESVGAKAGGAPDGPRLAAGFGLGALNDADDDDVDVYDSNANRGRTRMAYDIADREDDETIVIGGRSAKKAGPSTTPDTRSSLSSAGTFRDGTQVLPGFILSDQPVSEDKWFPLPDIPKGWKPDPRRVWDKDKENVGRRTTPPPQSHGKWKEGISADKRGSLLGETPLPAAPKSVFEYMSQKDRERLQSLASQRLEPPNRPTPTAPSAPPPIAASIPPPGALAFPRTEPHVATAALHGFQPFTTNPDKQARYTAYLRSQAAPAGATPPPPPPPRALPGQSAAEYHKELADYAKSAAVFKPLSAAMAGRFTSAAVVEYGPTAQEGLHTPSFVSAGTEGGDADAATKEEAVQKAEEKEEDPKTNAARLGMYGPLTREVKVWKPARLLCKRFGVKDPHPEPVADDADAGPSSAYAPPTAAAAASTSTVPAESLPGPGGLSAADAWALAELTGDGTGAGDERAGVGVGAGGRRRRDFANVGLGEDESQARDVLTYERPSMDVFKAIFASDDEDDGSDDEDDVPPAVEAKAPGAGGVPVAGAVSRAGVDAGPLRSTAASNGGEIVPAHLTMQASTPAAYDAGTGTAAASSTSLGKVDLASFRPTFVPRANREAGKDSDTKGKEKEKESRKEKKREKGKSKGKTLVSFETEEDADGGLGPALGAPKKEREKDRKRRERDRDRDKNGEEHGREKKKRKAKEESAEDEDMWVEKAPPEVVKTLGRAEAVTARPVQEREAEPPRGRKRAIDFM